MRTAVTLMFVALAASWAFGQSPAPEPRLVPSRRTALSIPFRVNVPNAAANVHDRPVEVQLYVSANRGLAWQQAGAARSEAAKIAFNAPGDGEYWFCVKTRDAAGRIKPPGPPVAELRVLVDATPPQLRLSAWRGVNGDVTARWDATDANLDPRTFKIEFRQARTNGPWQPIAMSPPLPEARTSYADTATWKSTTAVEVQAEIADVAGNVSRQIVESGAAPSTPLGSIGSLQTGPSTPGPTTGARPNEAPRNGATGAAQEGSAPIAPGTLPASPATGPAPAAGPPLELPWQRDLPRSTPWPPEAAEASKSRSWGAPPGVPAPSPGHGAGLSDPSPVDPFTAPRSTMMDSGGTDPKLPQRLPVSAPTANSARGEVANPFTRPGGMIPDPSAVAGSASRIIEPRPWPVNSREVEVAYDLGTIPGDQVRAVELWGTADGGHTWRQFTVDQDVRSPMTVKLEAEGVYGLRLVVQRVGGPLEFPPTSGQPPEMVIEVDHTEPRCQVTRVDQLAGSRGGELAIYWEATDRRLGERPVTLRYSQRPDGPWHTIAGGLENTGSYTWQIPEHLPAEIFLRLEVRDAADNVGHFTTPRPVTPQLTRPVGRIRSVAPVNAGRFTGLPPEPKTVFFR